MSSAHLRVAFAMAAFAAIAGCGQGNDAGGGGTGLTGDTRDQFVRGAVASCTAQGARDPRTANVPRDKLADYCRCSANALADRLSPADIKAINANPTQARQDMAPRVQASAQACKAKLQGT